MTERARVLVRGRSTRARSRAERRLPRVDAARWPVRALRGLVVAGKTPTFLTVWTPWQHEDLPGEPMVPFGDALSDIAKVRGVVGDQGLIYLDWNLGQSRYTDLGITT